MCGLFGMIGYRKDAASIVLEGLKTLEYRGYDSWGVAVVPSEKTKSSTIVVKKKIGKIGSATVEDLPDGTLAFGHTRWATHGHVTDANAHPHLDCTGTIALAHNGIVENYESLKARLVSTGHIFISETDTEVISHLVEEEMKTHSFVDAVRDAFMQLDGMSAITVVHTRERAVVIARNGSPLVIGYGEHENYVASDPAALLPYTRRVYFIEDGEMAILRDESVVVSEIATGKERQVTPQTLDWDVAQTEKGKYAHFMLKELHEQPLILHTIATTPQTAIAKMAKQIKDARNVVLIGCGSGGYVAQAGIYLFSKIADKGSVAVAGSEADLVQPLLIPGSLLFAISQSGETMDILDPAKHAKAKGVSLAALVNVMGSSLYRMADEKLLVGAGPEKAVATTKALTAQIALLILLAHAMVGKEEEGRAIIAKAVHAVEQLLTSEQTKQIQTLAKQLASKSDLYVVGRGVSYPLALEAAIKIKEVSNIHAEGLAGGELKHGTLSLISEGVPCLVYLPDDDTYQAMLSGAIEMKTRGGYIIGVSSKPHPIFDIYIHVEDAGVGTFIPNVIVAQLLSYYMALERGLDPDMPRNLAKSVTVK